MLPTGASKPVLENIIFDEVRKFLQKSFHNYISLYEKNIIQQCLQRKSFDGGVTSPSNIHVMTLDAG